MATTRLRSKRGRIIATTVVALSFVILACLGNASAGQIIAGLPKPTLAEPSPQQALPTTKPTDGMHPAVLKVWPAALAVDVRPNVPVTVRASSGTLAAVTLVDAAGAKVTGQAGPDGTWANSELLHPGTSYRFTVAAIGPDGMATSTTWTFRTLTPPVTATYSLTPNGGVVGVGMPVIIAFDTSVSTPAQRAEVEKRVKVVTVPAQPGAWGWLDDRQLMWRPEHYWISGTNVTVSTQLHGLQTGDSKWVTADAQSRFRVGPSMVSTVDMHAHTLTVRRDGAVIRTFPVSTGRPGPLTETRSGVKVIIERDATMVMDSATVGIPKGDPNYYKITTEWNLRLTWTGEFIHSAPWSVSSQGRQNVSHGCTNMAPADAEWMFDNSKVGDVVAFTGSTRAFKPADGLGVWVYNYSDWAARSALA